MRCNGYRAFFRPGLKANRATKADPAITPSYAAYERSDRRNRHDRGTPSVGRIFNPAATLGRIENPAYTLRVAAKWTLGYNAPTWIHRG